MSLSELTADDVARLLLVHYTNSEMLQGEFDSEEDYEDYLSERQEEMWGELSWSLRKETPVEGLGVVSVVHDFGGEGQGDSLELVFKVTEGQVTRHFEKTGYYASYVGSNWEEGWWGEVEPYQELVTKYRTLDGKEKW